MKQETKYVSKRLGRTNHFRVPEGYFDTLANRIISQLPEQQPVPLDVQETAAPARLARIVSLRRWHYAAACVAAIMVLAAVGISLPQQQADTAVAEAVGTESYFDEAADYAMVDNQEIYACLMSDL